MTRSDALRILNLEEGCSPAHVREAYLDLVKVWHPDRFPQDQRLHDKAVRALQDINDAYALLRDDAGAPDGHGESSAAAGNDGIDDAPEATAWQAPSDRPTRKSGDSLVRLVLAGVAVGLVVVTIPALLWPGLFRSAPAVLAPGVNDLPDTPVGRGPEAAAARKPPVVRPVSGTELLEPHRTGGGSLVVSNASGRDAVVALGTSVTQERAVYVRAGEQITLANVATGTYGVLMTVGRDWTTDGFLHDAAFMQLDQPVEFAEHGDGGGTEYTRLTVSLQPVVADMRGIRAAAPFRIVSR